MRHKTYRIYIDLDSLLDTRQGRLAQLVDSEKLAKYINSDEYNFRESDNFSIVDTASYKNLALDDKIIAYSTITYILNVILIKISNLEKLLTLQGEFRIPEIVLNIYPYTLSKKQVELIQNALFIKLGKKYFVEVINLEIDKISPFYLKNGNFVVAFIYDFSEWLNKHLIHLEKNKLSDIGLYFPAIYQKEPTQEELDKLKKTGFSDPFSYFEFITIGLAKMHFLPIVFYSNIVTSKLYLDKFNIELKKKNLEELKDGDSSTTV